MYRTDRSPSPSRWKFSSRPSQRRSCPPTWIGGGRPLTLLLRIRWVRVISSPPDLPLSEPSHFPPPNSQHNAYAPLPCPLSPRPTHNDHCQHTLNTHATESQPLPIPSHPPPPPTHPHTCTHINTRTHTHTHNPPPGSVWILLGLCHHRHAGGRLVRQHRQRAQLQRAAAGGLRLG